MTISALLNFVRSVQNAYAAQCRPVCVEYGLSQTAFDILMFLYNNPMHYTAREISTMRCIKPNVVSSHVEKLVKEGYIERRSVEGDRRKIRLVPTVKAAPIQRKGRARQQEFAASLKEGLSPEDLDNFFRCFETLLKNAEALQNNVKIME